MNEKILSVTVHISIIIVAYITICIISFSALWGYSTLFFYYFNFGWSEFFACGALAIGVLSAIAIIPLTTFFTKIALSK